MSILRKHWIASYSYVLVASKWILWRIAKRCVALTLSCCFFNSIRYDFFRKICFTELCRFFWQQKYWICIVHWQIRDYKATFRRMNIHTNCQIIGGELDKMDHWIMTRSKCPLLFFIIYHWFPKMKPSKAILASIPRFLFSFTPPPHIFTISLPLNDFNQKHWMEIVQLRMNTRTNEMNGKVNKRINISNHAVIFSTVWPIYSSTE